MIWVHGENYKYIFLMYPDPLYLSLSIGFGERRKVNEAKSKGITLMVEPYTGLCKTSFEMD